MTIIRENNDPLVIHLGSAEYPKGLLSFLESKAPTKLYAVGNLELLQKDALGFCGSRNVSEMGLLIAEDCARQAVENAKVVLSGNARGVDRMVHKAALEHGGETILILPEGIEHFRINRELKTCWDWERVLVISEFEPSISWKTWNAMKRNKTILSLVSAMIVIEAGEKGGTITAGKEALRMGIPLFVVNRLDMEVSKGGQLLLEQGGVRLNKKQSSQKANMGPIFLRMEQQRKKKKIITSHPKLV